MTEGVERRIGGLTVRIDRLLCVGFADCVDEAPEAFALDEEGIAAFTCDPGSAPAERLLKACQACPVDALTVLDAEGRQIVPAAS
ncbi:MAG: ferredoxin [Gemmatimonadota bacterium]